MSMEEALVIFFGKTGAGKNYIAEMFAETYDYYFYDADQDLPDDMRAAIAEGRTFTDEMRSRYAEIIKDRIAALLEIYPRVAVAQGLFKNRQRHELLNRFSFAQFVWVDAEDQLIEERVKQRGNEVTLEYARKINPLFETPDFDCERILNNGSGEEIRLEIVRLGTKLERFNEKR